PRRHRAGEAERVADRDHQLADAQPVGVAELGRCQVRGGDADDREVGERIAAHHLEGKLAAVGEGRGAPVGALDHVRRRQREAVGRDDDAGACSLRPPSTAQALRDAQARDRGCEPVGHRRHDRRVGVGGLGSAWSRATPASPSGGARAARTAWFYTAWSRRRQRCYAEGAMDYQQILYDVADGIATITLNRPETLNAWTMRLGAEVRHAAFRADRDETVRVIVVTGAGKGYCAGADMDMLQGLQRGHSVEAVGDDLRVEPDPSLPAVFRG